jgi:hypothetical protein
LLHFFIPFEIERSITLSVFEQFKASQSIRIGLDAVKPITNISNYAIYFTFHDYYRVRGEMEGGRTATQENEHGWKPIPVAPC